MTKNITSIVAAHIHLLIPAFHIMTHKWDRVCVTIFQQCFQHSNLHCLPPSSAAFLSETCIIMASKIMCYQMRWDQTKNNYCLAYEYTKVPHWLYRLRGNLISFINIKGSKLYYKLEGKKLVCRICNLSWANVPH